jgi:hypothetical protein
LLTLRLVADDSISKCSSSFFSPGTVPC